MAILWLLIIAVFFSLQAFSGVFFPLKTFSLQAFSGVFFPLKTVWKFLIKLHLSIYSS